MRLLHSHSMVSVTPFVTDKGHPQVVNQFSYTCHWLDLPSSVIESSSWHYAILPIGSTSGTSVKVSSWSGNPLMGCLCCWATGSIGPVQRPCADSFSMVISPKGELGSPSPCGTLTTNTHHPRSRRLFLGGCLLLSLVVDASHFSLGTVTSEQRASPMSPLGRGNIIRGCL